MTEIWKLVTSAGAATLLLLLVFYLARHYLAEWLTSAVRHSYETEIEQLRAGLERSNAAALETLRHGNERTLRVDAAIVASAAASQSAAFAHRLQSIQRLWNAMVQQRNKRPTAVGMTEWLTHDEVLEHLRRPDYATIRSGVSIEHLPPAMLDGEIEQSRLGSGDYLWSLFWVHRALMGRVAAYLDFQLAGKGDPNTTWRTDPGLRYLLTAALDADELRKFDHHTAVGGLLEALSAIERRFLINAAGLMSGELAASEMAGHAERIQEVARLTEADSNKRRDFGQMTPSQK
jgi:hypothetical protein